MISKRSRRTQPEFSLDETAAAIARNQLQTAGDSSTLPIGDKKRKLPSNFLLLADETLSPSVSSVSSSAPQTPPENTNIDIRRTAPTTPSLVSRQRQQLPALSLQPHTLIIDPTPGSESQYRIVSRLGAGAWAANYKALDLLKNRFVTLKRFFYIPRDNSVAASTTGYQPASETGHYESDEVMREAADQEYRISRVIRKRSENLFADSDIICAEKMFSVSPYEVYLVFPYVEARDLNTYMRTVIAPALSVATQQKIIIGDILQIISNILKIVARLSAIGIAHSDLTPGNILITLPDGVIKLIDFGLGCNFPDLLSESIDRTTDDELETRCDYEYRTTLRYKDPLAASITLTPANAKQSYEMFAVYACGIIARQLFDDAQIVRPITSFVQIDRTAAMPEYVYALIYSMTSPNINARLRASDYAVRFEIARNRYLAASQQT